MIGRILGVIIGVAIAATGYGLWRPATFGKYVDFAHFNLGDFAPYHSLVAWLIIVVGAAVAIAALQRPEPRRKTSLAATVLSEPEAELVFATAPPAETPVVDAPAPAAAEAEPVL